VRNSEELEGQESMMRYEQRLQIMTDAVMEHFEKGAEFFRDDAEEYAAKLLHAMDTIPEVMR
jgi:hypothetical protein